MPGEPPRGLPPEIAAIRASGEPEVKVILVTASMNEMNEMLGKKWKIASCYPHAKGCLMLMVREPGDRLRG